jgi:hypothetical protein
MILYHFTDVRFLEVDGTILAEGVKPAIEKQKWVLPPFGVVWLTADTEALWATRPLECRIRLAVPSHDRKLVHWGKWLRRHAPEIIEMLAACDCGHDHGPSLANDYVYFGTVPLEYFRAVEYADAEMRAAYEADITTWIAARVAERDEGATEAGAGRAGRRPST